MYSALGISEKVINLANEAEENIKDIFENIEKIEEYNSIKVLNAFQKNEISEIHFNSTTGYGYGDIGRDIELHVSGDGFLYNMVRIITGTLVDIGTGRIPLHDMKKILEAKNRSKAGHTAPPYGLYLAEVYY